jgi:hypothetical protein
VLKLKITVVILFIGLHLFSKDTLKSNSIGAEALSMGYIHSINYERHSYQNNIHVVFSNLGLSYFSFDFSNGTHVIPINLSFNYLLNK